MSAETKVVAATDAPKRDHKQDTCKEEEEEDAKKAEKNARDPGEEGEEARGSARDWMCGSRFLKLRALQGGWMQLTHGGPKRTYHLAPEKGCWFAGETRPFLLCIENLLTASECDAIMAVARASEVKKSPAFKSNETFRTSKHMKEGIDWDASPALRAIRDRAREVCEADATRMQGGWPILYLAGDKIELHTDSGFHAQCRRYTLLIYLNEVAPGAGGETRFPNLVRDLNYDVQADKELPVETRRAKGLCVRPRQGWALLFRNMRDDNGFTDWALRHEGLPVVGEGVEKYVIQFRGLKSHPDCPLISEGAHD